MLACFACPCDSFSAFPWEVVPRCRRCGHCHGPPPSEVARQQEQQYQLLQRATAEAAVTEELAEGLSLTGAMSHGRSHVRRDLFVLRRARDGAFLELAVGCNNLQSSDPNFSVCVVLSIARTKSEHDVERESQTPDERAAQLAAAALGLPPNADLSELVRTPSMIKRESSAAALAQTVAANVEAEAAESGPGAAPAAEAKAAEGGEAKAGEPPRGDEEEPDPDDGIVWEEVLRTESVSSSAPSFSTVFLLPAEDGDSQRLRFTLYNGSHAHEDLADQARLGFVDTTVGEIRGARGGFVQKPVQLDYQLTAMLFESLGIFDEDGDLGAMLGNGDNPLLASTAAGIRGIRDAAATPPQLWVHGRTWSPPRAEADTEVGCLQNYRFQSRAGMACLREEMVTPAAQFSTPVAYLRLVNDLFRYQTELLQERHERDMPRPTAEGHQPRHSSAHAQALALAAAATGDAPPAMAGAGGDEPAVPAAACVDHDALVVDEAEQTRILEMQKIARLRGACALYDQAIQLYETCESGGLFEYGRRPFKRSVMKKNSLWRFVPTNLCVQSLRMVSFAPRKDVAASERPPRFGMVTMTFGCFSAHAYGFKRGGLRSLLSTLARYEEELALPREPAESPGGVGDAAEPAAAGAGAGAPAAAAAARQLLAKGWRKKGPERTPVHVLRKEIAAVRGRIELRHVCCVSQALTALVAGVVANVHNGLRDLERRGRSRFLEMAALVGVLAQTESLLSTHGHEAYMLEDMAAAVAKLNDVTIELVAGQPGSSAEQVSVRKNLPAGGRQSRSFSRNALSAAADENSWDPEDTIESIQLLVTVALPPNVFAALPEELRLGGVLPVTAVIFSQGVNEMQTVANKLKETALQEDINRENLQLLKAHYRRFRAARAGGDAESTRELLALDTDLGALEALIEASSQRAKKNKVEEILTYTADITRRMHGVRMTCCKSGKDRTSMSATLEQLRVLQEHMPDVAAQQALDVMRSHGTRRMNVLANTGRDKFAFNAVQVRFLPDCYKPPMSTYASNVS